MREEDKQFFEFLFEMIEEKITTYHNVAHRGVGPDAQLIAHLTSQEVEGLFNCVKTLFKNTSPKGISPAIFNRVFSEIEQYAYLEHIRDEAGYLISPNNVHNKTHTRVQNQLAKLGSFRRVTSTGAFQNSYSQLAHDSYEIAHRVLQLAKELTQDPEAKVDPQFEEEFGHGFKMMRALAKPGQHYQVPKTKKKIDNLHTECTLFLALSKKQGFKKSSTVLTPKQAINDKTRHLAKLARLRDQLEKLQSQPEEIQSSACCSSTLFYKRAAITTVTTVAVGLTAMAVRGWG
ncbi:MAG TPA: hypothetical protein VLH77_04525 [Gammaproteobacteria bacterium]|nr:hypothetical protein [Gammaproteobacteria bacterium]